MAEIIWPDQALEDVKSIAEYISRDSFYYAQLTVRKIFDLWNVYLYFPNQAELFLNLSRKI